MKSLLLIFLAPLNIPHLFATIRRPLFSSSAPRAISSSYKTTENICSISPESQALFLSAALQNANEYNALTCLNKYPDVTAYSNPFTGENIIFEALESNTDTFYALRRILAHPKTPINARNHNQETPLIWAAKRGESIYIRILLQHNADVTLSDITGKTALHYVAAQTENIQIVETLLQLGADPNAQDVEGNTPLHLASAAAKPDIVQTLLQYNANPTLYNQNKKNPLNLAHNRNTEIILRHALKKWLLS